MTENLISSRCFLSIRCFCNAGFASIGIYNMRNNVYAFVNDSSREKTGDKSVQQLCHKSGQDLAKNQTKNLIKISPHG